MINMMNFQKNKALEIMLHQLNDPESRQKYRSKENKILWVYIALIALLIITFGYEIIYDQLNNINVDF